MTDPYGFGEANYFESSVFGLLSSANPETAPLQRVTPTCPDLHFAFQVEDAGASQLNAIGDQPADNFSAALRGLQSAKLCLV